MKKIKNINIDKIKVVAKITAAIIYTITPIICNVVLWSMKTPPTGFAYATGLLTVVSIWGISEKIVELCALIVYKNNMHRIKVKPEDNQIEIIDPEDEE